MVHDDAQGAALATGHLLDSGRRRLVHVTGATHHVATRNRAAGVATALAAAGESLVLDRPLTGRWSEGWGRAAVEQLLRSDVAFDGVVAGSDQVARGVTDALREADRRVPDDVAVVGFDNWDVMAEASRPPLTTIDPQLHELGHAAAALLLEAINGMALEPGVRRMPCRLVVRESAPSI